MPDPFQHWCRGVVRPAAPATRRRPATKRQRCGPHIKSEGDSRALVQTRSAEDEDEATGGQSDDDSEEEMQAEHGLQLHGLRYCSLQWSLPGCISKTPSAEGSTCW